MKPLLLAVPMLHYASAQQCSCGNGAPAAEFSVTYSRSTTKQIQDVEFIGIFDGPMYCTNYVIEDGSGDSSCGNGNSLDYIIFPTTGDCLNSAIWSLRDVTNSDYVPGFNPAIGASPDFYISASDPRNPTGVSGIRFPINTELQQTRTISICTRQDTVAFDHNDNGALRTIGYVMADGHAVECVNATMRDICSASDGSAPTEPVHVIIPTPTSSPSIGVTTSEPTRRVRRVVTEAPVPVVITTTPVVNGGVDGVVIQDSTEAPSTIAETTQIRQVNAQITTTSNAPLVDPTMEPTLEPTLSFLTTDDFGFETTTIDIPAQTTRITTTDDVVTEAPTVIQQTTERPKARAPKPTATPTKPPVQVFVFDDDFLDGDHVPGDRDFDVLGGTEPEITTTTTITTVVKRSDDAEGAIRSSGVSWKLLTAALVAVGSFACIFIL